MTTTTNNPASPLVGVVMGSSSDWDTMQHAVQILQHFGVAHDARVVSAHRMPDDLFAYAELAAGRGLQAIIAGAGGAAHWPGMLAAKTIVPVLGVPVASRHLQGVDSLHSIVQMPKGVPVATFAIGQAGAANAALFAVALLANEDPALRAPLKGRRGALLAHPASVTRDLTHSLDALAALPDVKLSAAFGPQHGLRGDKQDNMVESPDFTDPRLGIPVFSLYGEVRRPTIAMMDTFDVLLVDLQDLGCRIYTFITTLRYVLEAAAAHGKAVWVLDRPNPVGRPVEGLTLRPGWESFVGAGPIPMRHCLTLGELAHWFLDVLKLQVEYRVIERQGWQHDASPSFGWPLDRTWINPSPNAANLSMARAYAGTVMLEGTTLSEGRGTTRPLELFGAPDLDARALIAEMRGLAPEWLRQWLG